MSATHPVWGGDRWLDLPVASMGGEALVVPIVAAIVRRPDGAILLQRRDKSGEAVRGLLEIPAGRWHAGERAADAVRREVSEETGLQVEVLDAVAGCLEAHAGRPFELLMPAATVVGFDGAYPALVVAFECRGEGEPRPQAGETTDPTWHLEAEVRRLLEDPGSFTGVAAAVLSTALGMFGTRG